MGAGVNRTEVSAEVTSRNANLFVPAVFDSKIDVSNEANFCTGSGDTTVVCGVVGAAVCGMSVRSGALEEEEWRSSRASASENESSLSISFSFVFAFFFGVLAFLLFLFFGGESGTAWLFRLPLVSRFSLISFVVVFFGGLSWASLLNTEWKSLSVKGKLKWSSSVSLISSPSFFR